MTVQRPSRERDEGVGPVPVNADLEIEDKVLGPFTGRQAAILAAGIVLVWIGYVGLRHLVPVEVLLLAGLVVVGALVAAVTAKRDGLTLDRFALAGLRHLRSPKQRANVPAEMPVPDGLAPLQLPAAGLVEPGVLDLGVDGAAVLLECGAVNLALRCGDEVRTVLAGIGQALNALGGPFQIQVTAHRIDLSGQAERVDDGAAGLPHPLLEDHARAYAGFLRELNAQAELIGRRVLLVLREPGDPQRAAAVVLHRASQAAGLLTASGITARLLDAGEATALLAAVGDPTRPAPCARQATADQSVGLALPEHAAQPAAPESAASAFLVQGDEADPTWPNGPDSEGE
jgi:hypothetical protein